MLENLKDLLTTTLGKEIEFEVEIEGEAIKVSLPQEHFGRIIGKGGRTIKSIRELVFLHNKLVGTSYSLEVVER